MQDRTFTLSGARVLIGDGEVIESADITVSAGRIVAIVGADDPPRAPGSVPPGTRIDVSSKTIMPTITNVHGHIGYLRGGTCSRENYSRDNVIDHLERLAYYGVSVFQALGTDRDGVEISVRDAQNRGELSTARMTLLRTAGPGIAASSPGCDNGGAFFATDVIREVGGPADAVSRVREIATSQPDAIKVWIDNRGGTKQIPDQQTVSAIVDEAHRWHIPVIAHIYTSDDARKAINAGVDGLAHMVRSEVPDDELVARMRTRHVFVCSSIGIHRNYLDDLEWLDEPWIAETVDDRARDEVRRYFASMTVSERAEVSGVLPVLERQARRVHSEGVTLALSCDTGLDGQFFGVAEHREMEALASAGVEPSEIVRIATSVGAQLLGLADRGTIAVGKRADLIVLDDNPLENITNTRSIAEVYLGGQRLDRRAMSARWRSVESIGAD